MTVLSKDAILDLAREKGTQAVNFINARNGYESKDILYSCGDRLV